MPRKTRRSGRKSRAGLFPTSGMSATNISRVAVPVSAPNEPPALATAPPFRRVVRIAGSLGVAGTTTIQTTDVFSRDNLDYGLSALAPFRWQGFNVVAGRVFLQADVVGFRTNLQVAVFGSVISGSSANQTTLILSDAGTVAQGAAVAWEWAKPIQSLNIVPTAVTSLVTILNQGGGAAAYTLDLDVVFTG